MKISVLALETIFFLLMMAIVMVPLLAILCFAVPTLLSYHWLTAVGALVCYGIVALAIFGKVWRWVIAKLHKEANINE